MPFPSTLTTLALYQSSLRWFEACSCKLTSRDLPSSLVQPRGALTNRNLQSSGYAPSEMSADPPSFRVIFGCSSMLSSFLEESLGCMRPLCYVSTRNHGSRAQVPRPLTRGLRSFYAFIHTHTNADGMSCSVALSQPCGERASTKAQAPAITRTLPMREGAAI